MMGWVYALGGAAIVGLVIYFKGRLDGVRKLRRELAADRLDAIKDKKEIDDEVDALGPADVDARFKRWQRES